MRQESIPEGVEKGIGLMYYGFEHRLQGKAQEAAMAQLFLEDQERQMNDPKMPVCRTFPAIISGNFLATAGAGSNGKEPGV